ncbi:hypothetical protein AC578_5513 [Pseudocercospora eumusae]|uniref:Uncharacterized protein n=1 Tax=Pseudocercospora eumusae TaxID=321146 RepID=A0A139H7X4_9PEZI|nr:hypothetical protein AC578_5513 [Pseudocercospora eumusae]
MAPHWLFLNPRQLLRPIDEIHLFIFHEEKVFLLATFDQPPEWRVPSIVIDENTQQTPICELVLRKMEDAVQKRAFNGVPLQHYFADQQDIDEAVTITSNQQRILSIKLFLNDCSFNLIEKNSAGEDVYLDAATSICYITKPYGGHLRSKWVALGEESRFESPLSAPHLAKMFEERDGLQRLPTTQFLLDTIQFCVKAKEMEDGGYVPLIRHVLIAVKSDASQISLVLMEAPEESWMAYGAHNYNIIKQPSTKPGPLQSETVEYRIVGLYFPSWGHTEPTLSVTAPPVRDLVDEKGHLRVEWEPWTSRTELATAED